MEAGSSTDDDEKFECLPALPKLHVDCPAEPRPNFNFLGKCWLCNKTWDEWHVKGNSHSWYAEQWEQSIVALRDHGDKLWSESISLSRDGNGCYTFKCGVCSEYYGKNVGCNWRSAVDVDFEVDPSSRDGSNLPHFMTKNHCKARSKHPEYPGILQYPHEAPALSSRAAEWRLAWEEAEQRTSKIRIVSFDFTALSDEPMREAIP